MAPAEETNTQDTTNAATAPVEVPPLKDSSAASLSETFRALSERAKDGLKGYRSTFTKLNEFVSKFHAIPVDQVGVELATFDKLREYNLMNRPGSDDHSLYAILTIFDARFLVRVQEDNKIVTYTENINKPSTVIQYLDSDEFWYKTERSSGGTLKILKNEPKFNIYDLSVETDAVNFMQAIVETTAALSAKDNLRSFDAPPQEEGRSLQKSSLSGLKPKR